MRFMKLKLSDENLLIICGFLDLLSVSIMLNSLILHVKSFNVSTTALGIFSSVYGALQILSSYIMGYLADKTSQKTILCLCCLAMSVTYLGLGLAPTFCSIFVVRCISGLFKQTQTLSRTMLSTKGMVSTKLGGGTSLDRVRVMGRFSTLSSVGFIFGPPIGGFVMECYGFSFVACLTSLGFLAMFGLFLGLDNRRSSNTKKSTEIGEQDREKNREVEEVLSGEGGVRQRQQQPKSEATTFLLVDPDDLEDTDTLWALVRRTWDIQATVFLLSFCPMLFRTNYSLTLRELYGSTGLMSGFATSYGAITGSVAGLVVPYVIVYYRLGELGTSTCSTVPPESRMLWHTSLVLGAAVLGCGLSPSFSLFLACQAPISFVNGLSREAIHLLIARRVPAHRIGRVMGMNGSMVALGRLIAPVLGGLLQELSFRLPAIAAAVCAFLAAVMLRRYSIVS